MFKNKKINVRALWGWERHWMTDENQIVNWIELPSSSIYFLVCFYLFLIIWLMKCWKWSSNENSTRDNFERFWEWMKWRIGIKVVVRTENRRSWRIANQYEHTYPSFPSGDNKAIKNKLQHFDRSFGSRRVIYYLSTFLKLFAWAYEVWFFQ